MIGIGNFHINLAIPISKTCKPKQMQLLASCQLSCRYVVAGILHHGWNNIRCCSVLLTLAKLQIRTLLGRAQQSANQVNTNVTFKRQDLAYMEYLVSSDILLNLIPRHKDYPSLNSDRGEWGRIYKTLYKVGHTSPHSIFPSFSYEMGNKLCAPRISVELDQSLLTLR